MIRYIRTYVCTYVYTIILLQRLMSALLIMEAVVTIALTLMVLITALAILDIPYTLISMDVQVITHTYIRTYIHIISPADYHLISTVVSLSTVVLNSRDRYEKLWLPEFLHF